ncbi:hypothetical protein SAMN04487936_102297 [Halobacillus dabanensis]|uniref:Uncharacterized protein n=1 Tax=Halobacillus dabanensis TaxID=240302 RepID=A0A1I3RL25_HALDA|nr:hypothetical protein SAMN04487936_102297 [Halobacillus dabanensis]
MRASFFGVRVVCGWRDIRDFCQNIRNFGAYIRDFCKYIRNFDTFIRISIYHL